MLRELEFSLLSRCADMLGHASNISQFRRWLASWSRVNAERTSWTSRQVACVATKPCSVDLISASEAFITQQKEMRSRQDCDINKQTRKYWRQKHRQPMHLSRHGTTTLTDADPLHLPFKCRSFVTSAPPRSALSHKKNACLILEKPSCTRQNQ